MPTELNYLEKNKALWNKRTDYHIASEFYNVEGFLQGNNSLKEIEMKLLGDVRGKSVLHLQCHFGQDTISLARLGAEATGVDISDTAIGHANRLASEAQAHADFICCDLYSLPQHLDKEFDIVFTSYGTIGWLPDVNQWAGIVARYLKPGGRFVFADFHPVLWMFDERFEKITHSYFNAGPIVETETGTYADKDAPVNMETVGWNHNTGEVITALLSNGLTLTSFEEYDYSPYNCFTGLTEFEPGRFRLASLGTKFPFVFSLSALKAHK